MTLEALLKKPIKNEAGNVYGRLTVVSYLGSSFWLCRCSCGKEVRVRGAQFRSGKTKSCGCRKTDASRETHTTHGDTKLPFYYKWASMKSRCNNPNTKGYKKYGGKGVCVEWKSYQDFRADMYESYLRHVKNHGKKETTIDRVDPNGNYSKENCRWATYKEQGETRGNNIFLEVDGKNLLLKEWAKITGIKYGTLFWRYSRWGSVPRVISKNPGYEFRQSI